jgi:ABC-2 type transport system permease protein
MSSTQTMPYNQSANNTGTIFTEVLRRSWRQMIYWGIGLGLMALIMITVVPNVDTLEQYKGIVETMPPVLMQAFGLSDAETLATPEGFLAYGFFTYAILLLAVYAVIAGLNITAVEEDNGIMDVTLALPVKRWQVIIEKFAAYALMLVGLLAISAIGLLFGPSLVSVDINMQVIAESYVNLYPPVLLMMAFTMFIATIARRRSNATVIAIAFIVGSYFFNFIGRAATDTFAEVIANASFFYYADAESIVQNGLLLGNVVLLLGVSLLLTAGSVWAWSRRDVGL